MTRIVAFAILLPMSSWPLVPEAAPAAVDLSEETVQAFRVRVWRRCIRPWRGRRGFKGRSF
jgi:hypothetical protein